MSTTRIRETKDGRPYYEILVKTGRNQPQHTTRWYPPEGWSGKRIRRALEKAAVEFEQDVRDGKVKSRAQKKAEAEAARLEELQRPTLGTYYRTVYLPAKEVACTGSTMQGIMQVFCLHVIPELGELKMRDITAANLNAVILKHQRNHAHRTTAGLYSRLNDFFKMAFLDGTISTNPMDKVRRPRARKDEAAKKPCDKALTIEQVLSFGMV